MSIEKRDVNRMINAIALAIRDQDKAHYFTIGGLVMAKDFLEGLLEEGR